MSQKLRLSVVLVAFVTPFATFASSAAASFALCETWGNGTTGWTVTGAGAEVDCTVGYPVQGCSLAMQPPPDGTYTTVTHDPDTLVDQVTSITFRFRANSSASNTDTFFGVGLSNGGSVQLHLSDGVFNPNTGLLLISGGYGSSSFGNWDTILTWHRATIFIDPWACRTWAEVETTRGLILTSSDLAIPCTGLPPKINKLTLSAVSWTDLSSKFWYDVICLEQ